ncbi:MAG: hypothetical protein KatS3mg053_3009 [Candidatus Roseilinea sp.]|nr:MAG: hypothetical protein KatS3mg053_3009 [Candidatus Roseilinea sp.]
MVAEWTSQAGVGRHRAASYVAPLGGPEGFSTKLQAEVRSRLKRHGGQVAVIGDGAEWIGRMAERDYPNAAHIVDWYHVVQHLHQATQARFDASPRIISA